MDENCDLIWLRRDLRLIDNDLFACQPRAQAAACVYVLTPDWLQNDALDADHWRFLWESLIDLRGNLLTRGSDLLVCVGESDELLPHLMQRMGATRLIAHEMLGHNERRITQRVRQVVPASQLCLLAGSSLYRVHDDAPRRIGDAENFEVFSACASQLTASRPVSDTLPVTLPPWPEDAPRGLPSLETLSLPRRPDRDVNGPRGGEDAAWACLRQLQTGERCWSVDTAGALLRWQGLGCLSARQLMASLQEVSPDGGESDAARQWLRQSLLWQEYLQGVHGAGSIRHGVTRPVVDPLGGGLAPAGGALERRLVARYPARPTEAPAEAAEKGADAAARGSWYDRY
ncbi:deoxyribodipyrimidine photo-lyase [Salinicola avicenniae]|uniref:deoxyribodipyrimidine photo-lyase n=1 Tax=Salinicola avicenniae TaxID=2916836 RepID=UPI002073DCA8|nr:MULTISPECIES: deoxyribodipyrimidine photo-lyase [unclassified Salinicola]